MSDQNENDPGWWHRGMTRRAQIILAILSSLIVVGSLVYALASGIAIF